MDALGAPQRRPQRLALAERPSSTALSIRARSWRGEQHQVEVTHLPVPHLPVREPRPPRPWRSGSCADAPSTGGRTPACRAAPTALPGPSGASPQPSRIIRQTEETLMRSCAARPGRSEEVGRLEARPADQGAVDVGAGEQFPGVVRLDAPAIQDRTPRRRRRFAERPGEPGADERVDLLRLFGGRGQAGADRPDRLVGEDDSVSLRRQSGSEPSSCPATTSSVRPLRALLGLTDAHDREQADGQGRPELALTWSSVSPIPCRRSLWPRMTWVQPAIVEHAPESSPV